MKHEGIMSKKDKNHIFSSILKLNLILGIYNMFLFCQGQHLFNFIIGCMNIGVWAFCRDKQLILAILKHRKIKNQ